ncbi:uncharacterized protein LOC132616513 isoform X3 [Lycium barbarum]|nr:uncharacterized protein LOC132616513 isoform X3 [Lycium barbarum]XP_060186943.1 uncharacterized protein LOC132616513 isoform X3 [Lycium barbarum]XP_060186944.1 uncharacterized protein LOC132616513 isoform X3 [Lycium barbarum]XP_060186945.1 uncharacterized protein LOC132616513 isoform X3 [Lycium barbarum]
MAYDHLVVHGIMPSYDNWFCHGESFNGSTSIEENNDRQEAFRGDDMRGMIHDAFGSITHFMDDNTSEVGEIEPNLEENTPHSSGNQPHPEVDKFEQLMKDANEELYPGCKKFSKLSFLLQLYRIKLLFKWPNESFNALLGLLKDALPEGLLGVRKARGPTLLKDVWNLPSGKTIVVHFNSRNQAIGKEGQKLASFLGMVARTPELTPLNVDDWRVFDKEEKLKLVEFVKRKFSIPVRGEEFVKKSIGKKWKDYKCDLKTMYVTKYKTKDALMKNRPSHLPRDQWTGLVSYWLSDKAKERSQEIESVGLSKKCLTREDPKA